MFAPVLVCHGRDIMFVTLDLWQVRGFMLCPCYRYDRVEASCCARVRSLTGDRLHGVSMLEV